MESRDRWRTSTVSPTILSTSWRFSVQQGALLFGCCSPDTSLTRSGPPDKPTLWCIWISVRPNFIVYNFLRMFWFNLVTVCLFTQDDFAQNREFITLVVYKTDGKKVYYPGDVWCWNFFFFFVSLSSVDDSHQQFVCHNFYFCPTVSQQGQVSRRHISLLEKAYFCDTRLSSQRQVTAVEKSSPK